MIPEYAVQTLFVESTHGGGHRVWGLSSMRPDCPEALIPFLSSCFIEAWMQLFGVIAP